MKLPCFGAFGDEVYMIRSDIGHQKPLKQGDFSSVHLKQKTRIFARGYPGDGEIAYFN